MAGYRSPATRDRKRKRASEREVREGLERKRELTRARVTRFRERLREAEDVEIDEQPAY